MSTLARSLTILVVLVGAGAGLVLWETFVAGKHESDASISKEEMAIFLRDFNPAQLRALSQNPEEKKTLLKNLKEVLAIGSEARITILFDATMADASGAPDPFAALSAGPGWRPDITDLSDGPWDFVRFEVRFELDTAGDGDDELHPYLRFLSMPFDLRP